MPEYRFRLTPYVEMIVRNGVSALLAPVHGQTEEVKHVKRRLEVIDIRGMICVALRCGVYVMIYAIKKKIS
jgi:hypothetical protein